jgi:hypothetical protein
MKNKKTYYHLILDHSGSMSNCWVPTTQAFSNQMVKINQLAKDFPDQEFMVSVCVFNEEVKFPSWPVRAGGGKLPSIESIMPNGSTALFDAIGESVKKIQSIAGNEINKDEATVVMVILTDGYENASRNYSSNAIRSLMDELKGTEKWSFAFVGADFDITAITKDMNVDAGNRANFSKSNMHGLFNHMEESLRDYARDKQAGKARKNFFGGNNN